MSRSDLNGKDVNKTSSIIRVLASGKGWTHLRQLSSPVLNKMPLVETKSEKAINRVKVIVKVTRLSTLMSFKKASLVGYSYQI